MPKEKPPDTRKRYTKADMEEAFVGGVSWVPGEMDDTAEALEEAFERWLGSKSKPWKVTHSTQDEDDEPVYSKVKYFTTDEVKVAVSRALDQDDLKSYSIELNPDYTGGF